MGNGWSPICSGSFPLKGEHTDVKFPSQVETEQSLIILVIVVVVVPVVVAVVVVVVVGFRRHHRHVR